MFCLVAQLFSVMHMAVVQHTRCVEHGEWVHADEAHVLVGAVQDAARVEASEAALLADDEHEHCLVCAERRREVLPVTVVVLDLVDTPRPALADCGEPGAPRRVYGFSPKTSPPAHG